MKHAVDADVEYKVCNCKFNRRTRSLMQIF